MGRLADMVFKTGCLTIKNVNSRVFGLYWCFLERDKAVFVGAVRVVAWDGHLQNQISKFLLSTHSNYERKIGWPANTRRGLLERKDRP